MKNVLILGGTSGLGLELARKFAIDSQVFIAGRTSIRLASSISFQNWQRHAPNQLGCQFVRWDALQDDNGYLLNDLISTVPIHTLVYAAGFYQEGTLTDVSKTDIRRMLSVGISAPILVLRQLLKKNPLELFIPITSTSQWIPRKLEPVYTAVKAGLAQFANSMSLDGRIAKTLLVAPAGMKTPFWNGQQRTDLDQMLDPSWVADQIMLQTLETFSYRFVKILRMPPRIEIKETR